MAWLQNPEGLIQTEADQHIKINQEKFLLQFLKNDALVAEYQAIVQTQGIPGDGGANRQYIRSGGIRRQRLRRQIPPELSEQTRQNILSGLELYAQEMRANDEELEQWAAECDSLAGSLKKQWYPAQPGMEMRKYDFWNLIAGAKEECGQDMDASLHWLYEQLAARGPQQAQDFHDILYGYQKLSYQYGLWTAASLMCENVCDYNDFSYFRGWLIA